MSRALLFMFLLPELPAAPPAPRVPRSDLLLAAAVEDFVRDAAHAEPPEPYRSLIADLGADCCWRHRELAARRLKRHSAADPRWLFWGRRDPDPEIRLRCNNILRDLSRCPYCGGTGFCREFVRVKPEASECANCGVWDWSHGDGPAVCRACAGHGSGWQKGAFD